MPVTPDLSWGRVKVTYVVQGHPHTVALHIGPLAPGPYVYPYAWATPDHWTDLADFLNNLFGVSTYIAHSYHNDCTLSAFEVYKNNGTLPETFLFADNLLVPKIGASGSVDYLSNQCTYNFRTAGGMPAKVIMFDTIYTNQQRLLLGDMVASEQSLAAVMTSDANVLGHDGTKVQSFRARTFDLNEKLRKKYGYA
jgi:hypothetical protein